jgi:DNA-binding response OmpR family regulator
LAGDGSATAPLPLAQQTSAGAAPRRRRGRRSSPRLKSALTLDPLCSSVRMGTSEVALTSAECQILKLLMMNERRCVTREQILELLHGQGEPSTTRLPQVYMSRLRLKLRRLCGEDEPIANIKGSGWVFRAPLPRA